jgi:CheY-like chemotaxis protein
VVEAHSGSEALDVLDREDAITLVLTDHVMPGMTGLELVARVRRAFPEKHTILTSGFVDLAQQPLGDLSTLRLPKPFAQLDLQRAIAASVRNEPLRRPPRMPPGGRAGAGREGAPKR